jgi:hypothetical protein
MRQYVILILVSCAKVETSSTENTNANLTKPALISPTVEATALLKPVTTKVKLNSGQKKKLDESLPRKIREVLEKAEIFEVLAEVDNEPDGLRFEPNRIAKITDENTKKEILESFYYDASGGLTPSACYIPHHKIRAVYQGKTVEIEICFQCKLFFVEGSLGKFEGGLVYENQKSEDVLNQVIQNQSVKLK